MPIKTFSPMMGPSEDHSFLEQFRVQAKLKATANVLDPNDNLAAMRELGFEKILHSAAEYYDLSKNIADYYLKPVPIIWSDLPNRNGVGFPLEELTAWNKKKGCMAYKGWTGQAVRVEHDWNGPAIGLIPDVSLRKLTGFAQGNLYKVTTLLAIDRTKDPVIAGKVESGKINSFSMGCLVDHFTCSVCGSEEKTCAHLQEGANFAMYHDQVAFRRAHGIDAEEVSVVEDPAYGVAVSDYIIKYKD
jgi:hypothetical protein